MAEFTVAPPPGESMGSLRAVGDGRTIAWSRAARASSTIRIFPRRLCFRRPKRAWCAAISRRWRTTSATSSGAGDEVPEALRQMGCEVTLLSSAKICRMAI